jgi:hypothetical protein
MTDKPDDSPQWGEAMAALPNDRWRRFVVAIYDEDAPRKGKGLWPWAMERAGFKFKNGDVAGISAQRLIHDPRIKKACAEYSRTVLRSLSPVTIKAVRELLENPKSRHHAKAIDAVLARSDPLPHPSTTINIDNTVRVEMTGDQMMARIYELGTKLGISCADTDALLRGRQTPELLELRALKGEEPTP